MSQIDLNALSHFAVVAKHLNFRRAAAELALSPSTLSDRIRDLEERMGVRLINRTTRSASLTEEGRRLLDQTRDALGVLEDAVGGGEPHVGEGLTGRIRINGPRPAIELRLMPHVTSFMRANPGVRMEVVTQGDLVDVIAAGFDAGVRYEETLEQDMIAVSLGAEQRMIVAATPDYLERHGVPQHPRDLTRHSCIVTVFSGGNVLPWSLERDSEAHDISPPGRLAVNGIETALLAARASLGLIYTFDDYLEGDLARGDLLPVLEEWTPPFPGPVLYYYERRLMPPALRAFVDHVKLTSG